MKNSSVLSHMTLFILLLIVCIVVTARVSLATKDKTSIEAFTSTEQIKDNSLNESENSIINMLLNITPGYGTNGKEMNAVYTECLKAYLSNANVEIDAKTAAKVTEKIKDIVEIMNLEGKSDMRDMSLDGRIVAGTIIEQIYELCGLKLDFYIHGDIKQVRDVRGKILYEREELIQKEDFHFGVIAYILTIWIFLLTICVLIAKKNQLYIKDGEYGVNEKGFA